MDNNNVNPQNNSGEKKQTPEFDIFGFEKKPNFNLTNGDMLFSVLAIFATVFTAVFGIFGGFALGLTMSTFLLISVVGIYFLKHGELRILSVECIALALLVSMVFVCTSNTAVILCGVAASFLLALVAFDGTVNGKASGNRETIGIFYSALSTMSNSWTAVRSMFLKGNGEKKNVGKIFIGLACAFPVLCIVIPLLIMSDDAFSGMMKNMFSGAGELIFKVIIGLFMSSFVVSYGFSLKSKRFSKMSKKEFAGVENIYVISFLSAIAVAYLMYLFSQLAYFFSAFSSILPDGEITYAQYARKGFFEMCIIALINLGIVFLALLISKKNNGKVSHGIKALTTFIAIFTLIIISTAISKMVMYIDNYGMTEKRVTTSAFMIFLGIVFISVIMRIYIRKINIVKTALLVGGVIVLLLGTVNVNNICASYNYESYKSGKLKTIDVNALYELGDEGIPYIVKLADSEDEEIAKKAKTFIAKAYLNVYFKDLDGTKGFTVEDLKQNRIGKGFEHFSLPKKAAYDKLYEFLEENPEFSTKCKDYSRGRFDDVIKDKTATKK